MKKFVFSLLSVFFVTSSVFASDNPELSPYDFLSSELLKINSANAPYIQSDHPLAPLVNAFIADARNDKTATRKYLQLLSATLPPFLDQEIKKQDYSYRRKDLEKARAQILEKLNTDHPYPIFQELTAIRNITEFCFSNSECKSSLISPFLFSKAASYIVPQKTHESCRDITSFYPLCKGEETSENENPTKLQLAINYAQSPLKYYKDIRYKRKKRQFILTPSNLNPPQIPEGDWSFGDALQYMEYNPQKAYNTLKKAQTLAEKLQLAVFLLAYYPEKTKDIKDNLRDVVKEFDQGDTYIGYSRNYNKERFQQEFAQDLAEDNNLVSIKYLVEVFTSAYDKALINSPYLNIYCGVAKKLPEIISVTAPYYGSNRDNFITDLNCDDDYDYQKFPRRELEHYANLAEKADGHFVSNHQGSIRFSYYSAQNLLTNQAFLGLLPQEQPQFQLKYPYEVWSYLSYENRQVFEEIKQAYLQTHQIFMDFFINTRKFPHEKAQTLTENLLFYYPYGTRYWYRNRINNFDGEIYDTIPLNLRTLMIEQNDIEEIINFSTAADFLPKQSITIPQDYIFGQETQPAPLIHIAVQNPDYLKLLLRLTENMSAQKQQKYDMIADINAKNNINKTPLMVAAQFNFKESAKILIKAGADINAVTQSPPYPSLLHDHRTALMYAAENADLEMIKLLLDNGADKNMLDTRGYKAVDYLMGFAYGNYNQKLSDKDFEQALSLLL